MNSMQRLERLQAHLEALPSELPKFNLQTWHSYNFDGCGMTACAGGHAALMPEFIAEGLHMEARGFSHVLIPVYSKLERADALAAFFGLTPLEASLLFFPSSYPVREYFDPRAVARRIGELLAIRQTKLEPAESDWTTRSLTMEANSHTRTDVVVYEMETGIICARLFDWSPREVTVQLEAPDHVGQGQFYLFISREKAVKWLKNWTQERQLVSDAIEVSTQTAETGPGPGQPPPETGTG